MDVGGFWSKGVVSLYLLLMPLVAVPATLLREVEGHTFFSIWWGATPRYSVIGHLDWWRPPCQLVVSMFWSSVVPVVISGVACHAFVSRLLVPREPFDLRLLVESVVLPTEFPPGAQGGSEISVTGSGAAQNQDFQALRTPCSCWDSVLCA